MAGALRLSSGHETLTVYARVAVSAGLAESVAFTLNE
jgi:hypothetical protein